MVNQTVQRDQGLEVIAIPLLVVLAGAIAVVWAGGQLAAFVAHGHWLHASIQDAADALLRLPGHTGDPRSAWAPEFAAQLPGPVLLWAATGAAFAVAVALAIVGYKVFRNPVEPLDLRRRAGVPAQGRLAEPAELRPLLIRKPVPGRFVLGRVGRRLIATEAPGTKRRRRSSGGRGAVMPVGPSRSGKTTSIINGVFHWQHPAVLVSLKNDFLDVTGKWRAGLGDVRVFDPSGVTAQESATWSPLRASKTVSGAVRAARQIAEAAPRQQSSEQGDFWLQMAESLLAAFLVIAANAKDRKFADIVRWVVSTDMPTDNFVGEVQPLMRALKADGDPERKEAGEFAATVLEGLWRNDHRTVSSVYATARTMV